MVAFDDFFLVFAAVKFKHWVFKINCSWFIGAEVETHLFTYSTFITTLCTLFCFFASNQIKTNLTLFSIPVYEIQFQLKCKIFVPNIHSVHSDTHSILIEIL